MKHLTTISVLISVVTLASLEAVAEDLSQQHQQIEINKEADALKERFDKKTFMPGGAESNRPLTLQNYVLNKKVTIQSPRSLTPLQGGQYVPQIDEFLDLYMKYIASGMAPIEAIMMVHISPLAMDIIKKHNESKSKK